MILTFGLLAISVCSVWFKDSRILGRVIPVWQITLCAAVINGISTGYVDFTGVGWIALFCLITFQSQRTKGNQILRVLLLIGVAVLAFLLGTGKLPGFNNPEIVSNMRLSPTGQPFTHRLHFDGIVVGIILLAEFCNPIRTRSDWATLLPKTIPIILVTFLVVFGSGLLVGYVTVDLKFVPYTIIFFITNLLFTCVLEEAFFRGFLQEQFGQLLVNWKIGAIIAIVLPAILFGLAHAKGGMLYVGLATLAGICYGYAKYRVKRIEAAILTHFCVNALHFVAFTYPTF